MNLFVPTLTLHFVGLSKFKQLNIVQLGLGRGSQSRIGVMLQHTLLLLSPPAQPQPAAASLDLFNENIYFQFTAWVDAVIFVFRFKIHAHIENRF